MTDPTQTSPKAPDGPKTERPRRGAGWLSKIAPGVRSFVQRKETPDNLWVKCPETGEMIYRADLDSALWVTPAGHHMRIGPGLRLRFTFDDGRYETIAAPGVREDPLGFVDQKPYPERLSAARKATGARDAVAIGYGEIHRTPAMAMVQDFAFMAARWAWRRARASSRPPRPRWSARRPWWPSPPPAARACRRARSA